MEDAKLSMLVQLHGMNLSALDQFLRDRYPQLLAKFHSEEGATAFGRIEVHWMFASSGVDKEGASSREERLAKVVVLFCQMVAIDYVGRATDELTANMVPTGQQGKWWDVMYDPQLDFAFALAGALRDFTFQDAASSLPNQLLAGMSTEQTKASASYAAGIGKVVSKMIVEEGARAREAARKGMDQVRRPTQSVETDPKLSSLGQFLGDRYPHLLDKFASEEGAVALGRIEGNWMGASNVVKQRSISTERPFVRMADGTQRSVSESEERLGGIIERFSEGLALDYSTHALDELATRKIPAGQRVQRWNDEYDPKLEFAFALAGAWRDFNYHLSPPQVPDGLSVEGRKAVEAYNVALGKAMGTVVVEHGAKARMATRKAMQQLGSPRHMLPGLVHDMGMPGWWLWPGIRGFLAGVVPGLLLGIVEWHRFGAVVVGVVVCVFSIVIERVLAPSREWVFIVPRALLMGLAAAGSTWLFGSFVA